MASKSKKRRRVLGASCILAALIIAGSSFAWFTSSDEVTNRLTATADYGVSIVEDFSPPKAMTPGENVNKDVSVVNTGSIDAFTRVALENQLEITTYDKEELALTIADTYKTVEYYKIDRATVTTGNDGYSSKSEAESHFPITSPANTTYEAVENTTDNKWYIKTFTHTETLPDKYATDTERDAEIARLNGVNATAGVEYTAGDNQVVNTVKETSLTAPSQIAKGVTLSTSQSYNDNTGKLTPNEVTTLQAGGTLVMAASQIIPAEKQFVVAGDDTTPPTQSDYDGSGQYKPNGNNGGNTNEKTGLYIFKRTVYEGEGNNKTEYSGYYYDEATDTFYALKTKVTETTTGSVATPYIDFGEYANPDYDASTNPNVPQKLPYDGFTLNDNGEITAIPAGATVSLLTKSTYKTDGFADSTAGILPATVTPEFGLLSQNATTGADEWTGLGAGFTSTDLNDKTKVNAVKLNIQTGPDSSSLTDNGTVIYVKLDDNWADNWKIVEPASATASVADWFYYKDTVKSGETTEKLVDYVRIDNTTNQTDYVDLVYDLNVVLESKQITHNDEGDETATAVTGDATWATPTLTTTPVNNNGNVSVITAVDWTATP